MFDIKTIVVPTDFSKISFSAFEYARDLAERMNADIHLIYVMEKTPPFLAAKSIDMPEDEILKKMEIEARKRLHETALNFNEDTNIKVEEVLRLGNDFEEIVSYSKEIDADLIVIATHGRTGVLHSLLGSVAEKVIRFAKCPVLVISPNEEDE